MSMNELAILHSGMSGTEEEMKVHFARHLIKKYSLFKKNILNQVEEIQILPPSDRSYFTRNTLRYIFAGCFVYIKPYLAMSAVRQTYT